MMVTLRFRRTAALLIAAIVSMGGCSQEQQDWRAAERRDTTQSYGQFIERHPDSELVKQARTRIAQLAEDRDWMQAGQADTAAAYEEFLARHPSGKWAQEARIRMQNFALGVARPPGVSAPASVGAAPGTPATAATVAPTATVASGATQAATVLPARTAAATPAAVTPAVASTANGGATPATLTTASRVPGYGIQLGAFSSEERANTEWQTLEARYEAQLHGLTPQVVAADTTSGRVFRLQAQAGDEARARMICEELRKLSQQCVPVVPH